MTRFSEATAWNFGFSKGRGETKARPVSRFSAAAFACLAWVAHAPEAAAQGCPTPGNQPPVFLAGTPCATTFKLSPGGSIGFTVRASDPDPGQTACIASVTTNGAPGLPAGAALNPPLPVCGNPAETVFTWSPGLGQLGAYEIIWTAVDDLGCAKTCLVKFRIDAFNLLGEFRGSSAGGRAGSSVAGIGDLDGDGRDDFVVGAPGASRAWVVSGSGETILLEWSGVADGQFGCSVANAGDLDGDGVSDLLVGAREETVGGLVGAGRARAFSGATGTLLHTFEGEAAGERFGCAVANAGDVDGDGVPDLAVGSPDAIVSGLEGAGRVRIFSGATGSLLRVLDGASAGARLGFAVGGAGDLDGDGRADLLAGAPGANEAKVFSGADGSAMLTLGGGPSGGLFGHAVSGHGDVNLDGLPELLVGAPLADPFGLPNAGEVRMFSGADGSLLHFFTGIAANEQFGASVADAGDTDGDGIHDVLVGVPSVAQARVFSGWNGSILLPLKGDPYGGGAFGFAVASAGDVDADGRADLLVGAPETEPCGVAEAGQVEVFSTAPIPPGSIDSFGAGYPGSAGFVPDVQTIGGGPLLGNDRFQIVVSRALGGTTAVLLLGMSATSWDGTPLPLDLTPFGMPGALLLVAGHILHPTGTCGASPGVGRAAVPMPLPLEPVFAGSKFYFQWFVADPGPAVLPAATSRALEITIP